MTHPLAALPDATAESTTASAAIARAREAQPGWRALPLQARVQCLERFRRLLYERRADVAALIARENGKSVGEATMTEVATTLDMARFFGRIAPERLAPQRIGSSSLALWRKSITITHVPFGTVAVISPWNYPFMLPAGVVLPALVAGNAVLLKPSELTPASGALLGELLHEAGVPNDVLQVLPGDGALGAALTQGAVDKVFFTGSVATGRRVAHACAERLIPCALELGGSDPAIVLEDADIAHAASGITWGRFTNGGQTCVAPKRVFVVGRAYEPFVAAMRARLGALRPQGADGANFDLGPLIDARQRTTLDAQCRDATDQGALAARGDREGNGSAHPDGTGRWFPPTLLLEVPPEARVLQEETFGPLLPIVRVTSVDDAVARANASPFGLSASVWSRDRRAARAVADRLEAGTVVINDVTLIAGVAEVPHGGVKESGLGRSHGALGLEECVRTRTIVDDAFTAWRQPWWFGYGPDSANRADGYLRLTHGESLPSRLSGVVKVLQLLFRPERPI
jgi:succinate-semialdehyde dehydrogenase/glutarate-semialdehyde dehydrogenase